jgi:hypothetical protein
MMILRQKNVTILLVIMVLLTLGGAWYINDQRGQIEALNFRIMSLQYQNSVLTSRCNALESNLSSVFEEFEVEIAALQEDYAAIESLYNTLLYNYDSMEYEVIRQSESRSEIEEEFNVYMAQFKQLKDDVNSRLAFDGDLSRFVTPEDPAVIEMMVEISGGLETWGSMSEFWSDSKVLHDWVVENIAYAVDSPYPFLYSDPAESVRWFMQSVRYPNETLTDRSGDCEDQAILLESMMEAHNERFTHWCISVQWEGDGHVGVGIPIEGGRLAILDPSGGYHSGSGDSLSSEPVAVALEGWMSIVSDKEMYVNSVFSHELYVEFDSTDEFLIWFGTNYG